MTDEIVQGKTKEDILSPCFITLEMRQAGTKSHQRKESVLINHRKMIKDL